jgi:glutathione S-transferase
MRLLSGPLSLFSGKVRVALDEKGAGYTLDSVPFTRDGGYDPKPAEVLARNPRAQVPILVEDDGFAVWDSTVILEYLEERFPEPPLFPTGLRARARCRQLETAADDVCFPHVWTLIRERFYQPDPARQDAAAIAAATGGILAQQAELADVVAEHPHLCGEAFTVADVAWVLTLDFARRLGVPLRDDRPALAAWAERVHARPSVQREIARLDEAAARILAG